jgi:hypothetical protein
MIGRVIATTLFADLLFSHTEKGVFWWDDSNAAGGCWRKLVKGEPVTPANEVAAPILTGDAENQIKQLETAKAVMASMRGASAVTDDEPLDGGENG